MYENDAENGRRPLVDRDGTQRRNIRHTRGVCIHFVFGSIFDYVPQSVGITMAFCVILIDLSYARFSDTVDAFPYRSNGKSIALTAVSFFQLFCHCSPINFNFSGNNSKNIVPAALAVGQSKVTIVVSFRL